MSAPAPAPAWRHQQAGREFVHQLWRSGRRGAMLSMIMGCIDGDAKLIINRGGNAKPYAFRDLYRKFYEAWDRSIPTRTASLIDGELRLNEIRSVLHRGFMPVLKIQLGNKSLRVTPDHEIAAPGGQWIPACLLQPGTEILVNGQPTCSQCGSIYSVATYRYAKHRGLCRSCIQRGRRSKEKIVDKDGYVRLYGMRNHPRCNAAGQVYEHIVVMEQVLGRPITREEHVHHINHDRADNRPENLTALPVSEHYRKHGKEGGYLHLDKGFGKGPCFIPRVDKVLSVTPDGYADVYDLEMADPGHNFVANSIIVHNSGKTRLAIDLINDLDAQFPLILCPRRVVEVWRAQFQRFSARRYEFAALDDRYASVRDKMAHARDMRAWAIERAQRLAVCINYESARLEPFASWALKNPWPVVIADECVPPGSLISTPKGDVPIENLKTGDAILGYDHARQRVIETPITATFQRWNTDPRFSVGSAVMTPNHPVWTENRGYISISQLMAGDYVVYLDDDQKLRLVQLAAGPDKKQPRQVLQSRMLHAMVANSPPGAQDNHALRMVPSQLSKTAQPRPILQPEMFRVLAHVTPGICENAAYGADPRNRTAEHEATAGASRCTAETRGASGFRPQSGQRPEEPAKSDRNTSYYGLSHVDRRQRSRTDDTATDAIPGAPRQRNGVFDTHRRQTAGPEGGPRHSGNSPSNRGRRTEPRMHPGQAAGPAQAGDPRSPRLDARSVLELANPQIFTGSDEFDPDYYRVFNLETGTGNYFVNGLLVHNCHRIKQPGGRTSRFLARLGLRAAYRLGLTGTPMPHQPLDIWGQFHFLDPSVLDPTFGSFRLRHAILGGYRDKEIVGWRDLDGLHAKFQSIAFQVGAEALDLPEQIDETLETDLTPEGARIYREMEAEMVAWIRDMDGQGVEVTAANAMVRLQRLQQITGGSLPDGQGRATPVDNAKQALLTDFLADMGAEPVVVFAVYRADLSAIHEAARGAGLKCDIKSAEISGRRDELERWKNGEASVLAVQIQSGGEGIDLTRARVAVYYSHGYSLAQYQQSRSRIWRPPQTRPCAFYHLQIRNSIDHYALRAVLARQDLIQAVLQGLRRS